MFDSLAKATRCLESDLMKYSRQYAKYRREQNPNLIFSDIKPSAAPGVDILLRPIRAKVVEIDEEEGKLVLDKPCAFAEETQILCDGIPLDIIHHEADAVWVHDFDRVKVGMPLSQTQCIGTPQALADLFVSAWKERWMRHADVPIERWNAILAFAKTHIPPGRFQWDPISPAQLAQVIRSKKSRTSAGFDGVTLRDLKSMPPAVLRAFCDMYAVAESTGAWPSQLVDGRVVSLAKVASPSGPSDFRPITIFGLLYRCWSSFHARQALTRLDEVLPATLYGSRPGRHATQIWSRLLWTIEDSFAMDVPLTGAVADLTKAFNFLPRVVVMELAAHMGIPAYVLLSWTGALTSMRRRFQLRDSLSSGVASVTGVPEGCGLSCVAMVLVDVCFHTWMRVYFPLCMPVSFVDDWQLLTCHPTLLQGAIDCMNRFVTAMDLHLDDRKAYAWSISTEGRTLLRTQGFKVVLGAKNLGAHVQLSRKHTNSALQDRILDMTDIWPRLRLSACRYGNKIKALVTAAWPRALHAIAANTVSDASFQKLRAGAVKGLGVDGAGVNAWIQLGLIEQATVDPQCWAILQTFRCIRDCGDKGRVLKMMSALAYGDATQPANSFTMTLLARVQFLGWHVTPQGTLYDCLGEFCLFSCCLTELRMRIGWAWQMVVAQQVKHRWGLRDLQFADPTDTRLWLAGLSYDDQALFQKCLNGSHITQDCKVHCQEAGSDLCPFCQSELRATSL